MNDRMATTSSSLNLPSLTSILVSTELERPLCNIWTQAGYLPCCQEPLSLCVARKPSGEIEWVSIVNAEESTVFATQVHPCSSEEPATMDPFFGLISPIGEGAMKTCRFPVFAEGVMDPRELGSFLGDYLFRRRPLLSGFELEALFRYVYPSQQLKRS